MQEILFKAKRKDNGEWVEGYYVKAELLNCTGSEHCIIEYNSKGGTHLIDPETICPYTGLNDKNGNKIFDWDKCRFFMKNDPCSNSVGVVFWDTANAGFSVREVESGHIKPFDLFYAENCEVIGNINY